MYRQQKVVSDMQRAAPLKGVFLDFGYVIGFPPDDLDRAFLYLDWNGIDAILNDKELAQRLLPGIGRDRIAAFLDREIYQRFRGHEQNDGIDPRSNEILLDRLNALFEAPVDQALVDTILGHLNTMKYITIESTALSVVAALKRRGFHLALVSNMLLPGRLLRAKLQQAGALELFDQVVVSSDVGFIKPHQGIFDHALAQSGLSAGETVFVGDTYQQDIVGAKRAGMRTIWLNQRRERRAAPERAAADYEIGALVELLDLIDTVRTAG